MNAGDSLRRLGRFLEACERRTGPGVSLSDPQVSVTETGTRAAVEVVVRADQAGDAPLDLRDATLEADGALSLSLATIDDVVPAETAGITLEPTGLSVGPGSALTIELTVTVGDAADGAGDRTESGGTEPADGGGPRDPSVPPFEDRPYLKAIYESGETFEEMADTIEMDVTAETVRRYMIEHGIHDARSYDTTGAGADTPEAAAQVEARDGRESPTVAPHESPEVLADGLGLPEAVTLDELVDAVDSAKTIHQVGRDVGLDRMDALELLQRLDLLEFVMGRLSTESEREVGRERILDRIRRSADVR